MSRRKPKPPKVIVYHCTACKGVMERCDRLGQRDPKGRFLICPEAEKEWQHRAQPNVYVLDIRGGGKRHEDFGIEPIEKRNAAEARATKAIAQRQQAPLFDDKRVGMRDPRARTMED